MNIKDFIDNKSCIYLKNKVINSNKYLELITKFSFHQYTIILIIMVIL